MAIRKNVKVARRNAKARFKAAIPLKYRATGLVLYDQAYIHINELLPRSRQYISGTLIASEDSEAAMRRLPTVVPEFRTFRKSSRTFRTLLWLGAIEHMTGLQWLRDYGPESDSSSESEGEERVNYGNTETMTHMEENPLDSVGVDNDKTNDKLMEMQSATESEGADAGQIEFQNEDALHYRFSEVGKSLSTLTRFEPEVFPDSSQEIGQVVVSPGAETHTESVTENGSQEIKAIRLAPFWWSFPVDFADGQPLRELRFFSRNDAQQAAEEFCKPIA